MVTSRLPVPGAGSGRYILDSQTGSAVDVHRRARAKREDCQHDKIA